MASSILLIDPIPGHDERHQYTRGNFGSWKSDMEHHCPFSLIGELTWFLELCPCSGSLWGRGLLFFDCLMCCAWWADDAPQPPGFMPPAQRFEMFRKRQPRAHDTIRCPEYSVVRLILLVDPPLRNTSLVPPLSPCFVARRRYVLWFSLQLGCNDVHTHCLDPA